MGSHDKVCRDAHSKCTPAAKPPSLRVQAKSWNGDWKPCLVNHCVTERKDPNLLTSSEVKGVIDNDSDVSLDDEEQRLAQQVSHLDADKVEHYRAEAREGSVVSPQQY